jgi:hypothetical protein
MAAASHLVLTNGAQASRVFWQINGAGAIGANAGFTGTLMAVNAVAVGNGSVVNGRAFALSGALTLDDDEFYSAPPVVTITGGASAYTTDTTPTISGTTDVEAPGVVTVTVNGQTLTATPSDGAWSVPSAILANGTYPVVASVTDGAGNPGSATQQLTVDTVPPVVTLDGGASVTTNDPTRTIAGTIDAASGTVVRVTVDSQTLTALAQPGGTWNVTPTALTDGTRTVTASITDPAGNQGTDSQGLTVDTIAPAVTITGGANALTNDATPDISGTANVAPGTTVTVTLADQTLTGLVGGGGAWSVTAAALSDGPHRVIMSVSDAAGNLARYTQWLTVNTVPPVVTITGGATATTNDLDPTITGTSNAAPGTTVTVSIAGQTMTTLLQANGTWNATPTSVGDGTWPVVASAPDPAGNVGIARQTLTIATGPPSTATGPPLDRHRPPLDHRSDPVGAGVAGGRQARADQQRQAADRHDLLLQAQRAGHRHAHLHPDHARSQAPRTLCHPDRQEPAQPVLRPDRRRGQTEAHRPPGRQQGSLLRAPIAHQHAQARPLHTHDHRDQRRRPAHDLQVTELHDRQIEQAPPATNRPASGPSGADPIRQHNPERSHRTLPRRSSSQSAPAPRAQPRSQADIRASPLDGRPPPVVLEPIATAEHRQIRGANTRTVKHKPPQIPRPLPAETIPATTSHPPLHTVPPQPQPAIRNTLTQLGAGYHNVTTLAFIDRIPDCRRQRRACFCHEGTRHPTARRVTASAHERAPGAPIRTSDRLSAPSSDRPAGVCPSFHRLAEWAARRYASVRRRSRRP